MNRNFKKIVKIAGLSTFFLLIIIFAFSRSKDLIFGVKIKNVTLTDGATTKESVVKMTGNAKNAVYLTLNGREISIDQKGNFSETIALLPGYNRVSIEARDKFGYEDEKNYQLILAK